MRSSNYGKMYNDATMVGVPAPRAPQCKAPGVILLVIGCLEFFVFIFSVAEQSKSGVADWWVFLLSSAGMITTGSLAVAASNGKPHGVSIGAIVMASLSLAWTVIKLIILLVAFLALIVGSAVVNESGPSTDRDAENVGLTVVWVIFAVVAAFTVTTFVCLICVIVAVSKVTCCRSTQDRQGIVIHEQPPAVTVVNYPPPYSNQHNQPC